MSQTDHVAVTNIDATNIEATRHPQTPLFGGQVTGKRMTGMEIDAIVSASRDKQCAEEVQEFALERAKKKFGNTTPGQK